MKLTFIVIFLFSGSLLSAQQIARVDQVEITSAYLQQQRPILIYTPPFYDENTLVHYDVIYVFDAQNRALFDLAHALLSFIDLSRRYIVVGVTSPYYEDTDYARNHDYLPEPLHTERENFFGGYCCNSANLKKFVQEELEPYIRTHYRATRAKIGVGHSLSASFVLDFMLSHGFFDACLALSPNLAYDKEQLAQVLLNFNFNTLQGNRFFYLSHAGETWPGWVEAREKVYARLQDRNALPPHITAETAAFPEEDHWYGYLPALKRGLERYFEVEQTARETLSEETYSVKIRVIVPDPEQEVYLTGNQQALGNWDPAYLKMKKIKEHEREIELKLQTPARIVFTRGRDGTEALVKRTYGGEPITLDPSLTRFFEVEIEGWIDDEN